MKKNIVKTVSLGNNELMRSFVAKQSNFSKTVMYLIYKECMEKKAVVDLSATYDHLLDNMVITRIIGLSKNDEASNIVKFPGKDNMPSIENSQESANLPDKNNDGVPPCYL